MIDIGKTFDPKNIDAFIQEVVPEHQQFPITAASIAGGKLVIKYMQDASDRLYIFDTSVPAKKLNQVQLPKICSIFKMTGKWNESILEVKINDFISPGTAYEVNTNDYSVKLIRKSEIPDKTFKSEDFVQEQVFYTSKDGTKVPMFIVRKKSTLPSLDTKPSKPIPTLLYGYGGFGVSQQPDFGASNLIMTKNLNAIYVVANIRGGGEYGEQWHTSGSFAQKQNSYDDFIAAA